MVYYIIIYILHYRQLYHIIIITTIIPYIIILNIILIFISFGYFSFFLSKNSNHTPTYAHTHKSTHINTDQQT